MHLPKVTQIRSPEIHTPGWRAKVSCQEGARFPPPQLPGLQPFGSFCLFVSFLVSKPSCPGSLELNFTSDPAGRTVCLGSAASLTFFFFSPGKVLGASELCYQLLIHQPSPGKSPPPGRSTDPDRGQVVGDPSPGLSVTLVRAGDQGV